jgi:hypothetical protein
MGFSDSHLPFPIQDAFFSGLLDSSGRAKSTDCDGMRRCQRLPEFTHPVDSARPHPVTSNRVPEKSPQFRVFALSSVTCRGRTLTSVRDGSVVRAQPFAEIVRLPQRSTIERFTGLGSRFWVPRFVLPRVAQPPMPENKNRGAMN